MESVSASPTSTVAATKKRPRERNAIAIENSQRNDG